MKRSLRILSMLLAIVVLVAALPMNIFAAVYDPDAAELKKHVYVTIDEPKKGSAPDFTLNSLERWNMPSTVSEEKMLSDATVIWTVVDTGATMTEADVFEGGKTYELEIKFPPSTAYVMHHGFINSEYVNAEGYSLKKRYYFEGNTTEYVDGYCSTFESLKEFLEHPYDYEITLTQDIVFEIKPIALLVDTRKAEEFGYDPFEDFGDEYDVRLKNDERGLTYEDPRIYVRGNKILNLNGHSITVADNSNIYYTIENPVLTREMVRYTQPGAEDSFERALLNVHDGATLTIRDDTGKPGTIHYDAWMVSTVDATANGRVVYPHYAVRDIVDVNNATLIVENGVLEAGRSKKQWIVDGTIHPSGFEEAVADQGLYLDGEWYNGNAYQQVWGSAIHAGDNALVYINGGSFFGRGQGGDWVEEILKDSKYEIHGMDDAPQDAVIDGSDSATVVINGGYFSAKGGADMFYFGDSYYTS